MTFIKPHQQKSLITAILIGLVCLLVGGGVTLAYVYTKFNDAQENLRATKETFQKQQAQNAALKGELLSLFDAARLAAFAKGRSLVLEKNPSYEVVDEQWHFASEH